MIVLFSMQYEECGYSEPYGTFVPGFPFATEYQEDKYTTTDIWVNVQKGDDTVEADKPDEGSEEESA